MLSTMLSAAPASAGTAPNLLDDNRGVSATAVAVSAALTTLLGFPVVVTGRALSHPAIHNLYWDDNWNGHNAAALSSGNIDGFTTTLVGSHYLDPASQYGVGSASFSGSHGSSALCGPRRPTTTTSFFAILAWVSCEVGGVNDLVPPILPPFPNLVQGLPALTGVPSPDGDSLYVAYLPTGVTISDFGLSSCGSFGAYHFMSVLPETKFVGPFPTIITQSFAFAVVPADCASGTMSGISRLASHEIIEGATDPIFGLGWIDNSVFDINHIVNIATQGEAADICSSAGPFPTSAFQLAGGITVVPYWSNRDNACVPLAPTTTLTIGSPSKSGLGATFVTSTTDLTLTGVAPSNPANAGDTLVVHFRFWRQGTPMSAFMTCAANPCVVHLNANDGADGLYTLEYFTADTTNSAVQSTQSSLLRLDNTPPTSTLSIGTPQFLGGTTLFVTSGTPFTVTAADAGSGVASISFREFAVGAVPPAYTTVLGSFATFTIGSPDGAYEVDTLATDNVANAESPHAQFVTLDNSAPAITIVQPAATSYVHSATLTLNYSVVDSGSGVNTVAVTLDGSTTLAGHGLSSGQAINLLTELALGSHTFTIDAIDNLGNERSVSVTFTIIVTADSIKDDVNQFLASGDIKNGGLANSLLAKLNAAAAAEARGQCGTADNIYQAFIHEVQAQSGKGISAVAASILIADAQYLIAQCGAPRPSPRH
jgi:hypothetical protein